MTAPTARMNCGTGDLPSQRASSVISWNATSPSRNDPAISHSARAAGFHDAPDARASMNGSSSVMPDGRDDVVERDVPEHAARHRALGLELVGDEQHDGRGGGDADGRRDGRFERVDAAGEMQQREHRRERQRAFGEPHRQQPAVVARPLEIEAASEVEHDEPERELGEHARLREHRLVEPVQNAGPEQETDGDVAGDRGQHARRRREASADESASSSSPKIRKALAAGGQAGRKSGAVTGIDCSYGRQGAVTGTAAYGRILSPATASRLRSGFTRSSRDTPSHMTSDAITSTDE